MKNVALLRRRKGRLPTFSVPTPGDSRVENEEHDKSRTQQHGFTREPPLREQMVLSEGSWELETYVMCATIYNQSTGGIAQDCYACD